MTDVSAVIINYNARSHVLECVRSLRAEGLDHIVVADNASTDGSEEALRQADPAVSFLSTGGNLGFGAAANRGVAATTSEFVAVLNPDVVVEPGSIKAMVDTFQGDPQLAIVGPRIENPDGTLYPSVRTFPCLRDAAGHAFLSYFAPRNRFSRRYRLLDWDHSEAADVDWVAGTFMLLRRSAFASLGGFDESYFMYVEDVDLCWRAGKAGWRVGYEPGARVIHVIGVSTEQAPYRMILAHHRSLLRFAGRIHTGPHRLLLPVVGAGLATRAMLSCVQRGIRRRPPAAP